MLNKSVAHFAQLADYRPIIDKSKMLVKLVAMANVGIEPKTFALLARRSNQLS